MTAEQGKKSCVAGKKTRTCRDSEKAARVGGKNILKSFAESCQSKVETIFRRNWKELCLICQKTKEMNVSG